LLPRHCYFEDAVIAVADEVRRRCVAVAQLGPAAGGEDGGHPVAVKADAFVAYGVDAAVDDMEATGREPMPYRAPSKAHLDQLPPGNNAVLTPSQVGKQLVQRPWLRLCTYNAPNCNRRSHDFHADRPRRTRGLRL
jgi:hypothetical protein